MSFWDFVQESGREIARWMFLSCAVALALCVAWAVWYMRKRP
jgi:hypothetical protein